MWIKVARRLPRVDKEIFHAIWNKTKETKPSITRRAIYLRIEGVRKKFKKTISARMAANILAAEMDIDVYGILKDKEELKELNNLLRITPPQAIAQPIIKRKKEKEQPIIIGKQIVTFFGLPRNLEKGAERMAEAYPSMYVFENLIRYVVMTVLEKKYKKNWWNQPNVISNKIRRRVEGRKRKEGKNKWHSRRGSHEIFYTDFADLSAIISTNCNEFKEVFGDLQIEAEMRQLELSRNIIAHNNPLPPREVTRIKMYLEDLQKQLNIYVKKGKRE